MFPKFVTVSAITLAFPLSTAAAPVTYEVDDVHTFPHFMVGHLGVTNMIGRFNKTTGTLVLDKEAKSGTIEITIETASVDTGPHELKGRTRTRDDHLRTPDFFNSAEFPRMTYKGSAKWSGEWPTEVQGQLTLLGVTRPLSLKVENFTCKPDPRVKGAREICGGNATGSFKRSDFGMKFALGGISDEIKLMIPLEALGK